MSSPKTFPPSQPLSRRGFLSACAGCAACATCSGMAAQSASRSDDKARVRLVFTHMKENKPTWPYEGYDYEGRKKAVAERLQQSCPNVEFFPATVCNADDARKVLEGDREVDGYLLYLVGLWSGGGAMAIAAAGKPTLFVDDLYGGSGEFLIQYAAAKRKGLRVAPVSSSRFEDVVAAVRYFEVLKRLSRSVILDVQDRKLGADAAAIFETFGTQVRQVTGEEINAAYEKASPAEGQAAAAAWIRGAQKIVEPSREEIGKSGRMYVAMQDLMKQHQARAITVDCLTLFYSGKLTAYPCLGFFQLNNDGYVGACEGDLQSTITMLAIGELTGRPGYISDPVIDASKNQIIYAHCVAPNKVFGPKGPANKYEIRSHSEDRKGAAVRSLLPLNEMTTTLRFHPGRKEVILHQARAVANIDEDKACRTKLAAEIRDPYKMIEEYDRWGWHRVTFYGDCKRQVEQFSGLLGFKVVEEG